MLSEGYNYSLQFQVVSRSGDRPSRVTPHGADHPLTLKRPIPSSRFVVRPTAKGTSPLRRAASPIFSRDTSRLFRMNTMTLNSLGPAKLKSTSADQIALFVPTRRETLLLTYTYLGIRAGGMQSSNHQTHTPCYSSFPFRSELRSQETRLLIGSDFSPRPYPLNSIWLGCYLPTDSRVWGLMGV